MISQIFLLAKNRIIHLLFDLATSKEKFKSKKTLYFLPLPNIVKLIYFDYIFQFDLRINHDDSLLSASLLYSNFEET